MASWIRALFNKPAVALVPPPDADPATESTAVTAASAQSIGRAAVEHYGLFDDDGRCLAMPSAKGHSGRYCELVPHDDLPSWRSFVQKHGTADILISLAHQQRPLGESGDSPHAAAPKPLRVVVISDTHEFHQGLTLPPGDILLHCGDVLTLDRVNFGVVSNYNLRDFFKWFNAQPFALRIVIGGNHDHQFAKLGKEKIRQLAHPSIYLQDDLVDVGGLRILGSPRSTPNSRRSGNQAFQSDAWFDRLPDHVSVVDVGVWRGAAGTAGEAMGLAVVERHALPDPDRVDFFMTHGAPNCQNVRQCVAAVRPALHFCGHVHEMHGVWVVWPHLDTTARLTPHDKCGALRPSQEGEEAPAHGIVSINGASTRGKIFKERLEAPVVLEYVVSHPQRAAMVHRALRQLSDAAQQ